MTATSSDAAAILNAQRGTAYAAWTPYLVLLTADPGDTGSFTSEITGGGYARPSLAYGAPVAKQIATTGTFTVSAPAGTVVTWFGLADHVSNTGASNMRRRFPVPGVRTVTDAVTNGTTTITSATALFTSADQGKPIQGTNIPAGATIVGIGALSGGSSTSCTISANATGSGTVNATIGGVAASVSGTFTAGAGAFTSTVI